MTSTSNVKEVTEHNRKYWNDFAGSYLSQDWQKNMVGQITDFIQSNIPFLGVDFVDPIRSSTDASRQVRVLDYACGPGIITNALGKRATEYIGIDLSENMIQAYNLRFSPDSEDSPDLKAHGYTGNLLDEENTPPKFAGPEFFNFDLVAVGMGFHHFPQLDISTKRLVDRIRPGGVLMITDIVKHGHDDTKHAASHTIIHHGGFSEESVQKLFGDAGLEDVRLVQMDGTVTMGNLPPMNVFMARGRKPM